jgi:transposase
VRRSGEPFGKWTCRAKKTLPASERDEKQREEFRQTASAINAHRFIFVDEAAANLAMTRLYGRAPRGERVSECVPRNYGESISVLGALSVSGVRAAMTVDGAVDTLCFDAFITQILVPQLHSGDVVVLDNLNVHKASQIEAAAEAVGASVLWLPAYSPDMTPIEQCWSKIKAFLRSVKARTRAELDAALAQAIKLVTASDALGWFTHCGYKVASG